MHSIKINMVKARIKHIIDYNDTQYTVYEYRYYSGLSVFSSPRYYSGTRPHTANYEAVCDAVDLYIQCGFNSLNLAEFISRILY